MSASLERTAAIVAAAVAMATGMPSGVAAEKTIPVDIKVGADAVSAYVWRGQVLTDDPVFQPAATVSYKGLSLNVWGSLDMTDIHETSGHTWRLQEVDYTLAYAYSPIEGLDLQGGAIVYTFPGTAFASTAEVFALATLSKLPLAPTVAVYRDVDEVDGWYGNAGVSHTFALTSKLGLALGASVGLGDADYHGFYFGEAESRVSDLLLSSSLNYAVNEHLSLSLYLKFSDMLDSGLRHAARSAYGDVDVVFGGVNATVMF